MLDGVLVEGALVIDAFLVLERHAPYSATLLL